MKVNKVHKVHKVQGWSFWGSADSAETPESIRCWTSQHDMLEGRMKDSSNISAAEIARCPSKPESVRLWTSPR